MSGVSFSSLRSLLGKTDGPVHLSDLYGLDPNGGITAQGTGLKNVVGIQQPTDLYQSLNVATRTNVIAVYSTRLLNRSYAGPVVQVRRLSDNVTRNFYSDLVGNLKDFDGVKYNIWIGSSTGVVIKWYDQSGNTRDATNTASPVLPPRLALDPAGSGRYVLFFPNSKIPDADLKILLSFNSTFPTYNSTGGTAPTFDYTSQTDNWVKFAPGAVTTGSASCQFMNFGSQTFNVGTKGFTVTCRITFTGTAGSGERVFDFSNGGSTDSISLARVGTTGNLQFTISNGGSQTVLAPSTVFSQSTAYNIAVVYDPTVTANGTLYFYVNGSSVGSSSATFKPTDRTLSICYIGKPDTTTNGALNANIFSFKAYNRALNSTEVAAGDEYGNNYSGLTIASQGVTSFLSTFYPIQTLNTFHTLLATSTDLSVRFWADPNAIGGGPWPVGSANNPTYKLFNTNTGDFMNSSGGGYCYFNNTYANTSPYCAFLGGSWNTMGFSRSSGTVNIIYIGQHAGAQSRAFYGYMSDLITLGGTLPVTSTTSETLSIDYKMFNKLSMVKRPWATGLVGRYTGDSWSGSNWTDTSGFGNHVTNVSGNIIKTTSSDAFGLGGLEYIYGGTTASLTFPSSVMSTSNYTLMHIARYNGANQKRILTAGSISETDLKIKLTYLNTSPAYNSTGGAAPTWDATAADNFIKFNPGAVLSNSTSCQFLNFGTQTFNLGTKGISIICRFRFTGTAGSWERLFDFGNGQSSDNISVSRNGNANTLVFFYYNGATQSMVYTPSNTFAQNTIYTIAFIYNPSVGTNGTVYFYINGSFIESSTVATAKCTDRTLSLTYVGKSNFSADNALNADIFSLKVYDRVLSGSEISSDYAYRNHWVSGFLAGNSGVAYHGNTQLTTALNRHGSNWVLSTDQHVRYRSLGCNRTSFTPGFAPSFPLAMTVNGESTETSDWAVACLMVFNRVLTLSEYLQMEDALASRYRIPIPIQEGLVCSVDAYDYISSADGITWRDRSPNGYNFKLTSTLAINTIPPYMYFGGTEATMYAAYRGTPGTTGDDIPFATNMTMVFITQTVSTTNSDDRSLTRSGALAGMHHLMIDLSTGEIGCYNTNFINCDNPLKLSTLSGSTTRFNMWVLMQSTSSPFWQLYYNPTSLPLTPVAKISSNSNAGPLFGVSFLGANAYNWPTLNVRQRWGNIATFLFYHRRLTQEEMVDIYNRYVARHNLPTDKSHYQIFSPYIWLRASDLSSLAHGATVSTWTSAGQVWSHTATGYNVGTATLPTFDKTSESQPFVRIGTNTTSTANGNYFDFGSKTFNLLSNGGFTFVGFIRFRTATSYEKVFDFGSGGSSNNILLSRLDATANAYATYYVNASSVFVLTANSDITGGWQTVAIRVTESEIVTFMGTKKYVSQNTIGLTNRTFTNTYIGRSQFGDAYANYDIRDMAFYEKALSDLEIAQVRTYFESVSQTIPASINSRAATAKNAIVTSGLGLWIDISLLESYNPEISTTIMRDISGNNNNFTLASTGYSYNSSGYLNFSGTSTAYATGPNASVLGITYDHTVEILFQSFAAVSTVLFNTVDTGSGQRMINLHIPFNDNKYYYDALWSGSTSNRVSYTVSVVSNPRYIVCRCRTTSGTTYLEMFENGVLKAGPTTITRGGTWNSAMKLFTDQANGTNWKSGNFHFFRLYNRALSDTEMTQNYNFVISKYGLA